MNITATKIFLKLLLKKKRNYKKELFVGVISFAIATGAYLINQAVGTLLVITYLFVASTTNFTANDIFWNADDFKSLNISVHSVQYFVFFLLQKILLDTFVSNLIVFVGLNIVLLVKFGALQALAFSLSVAFYFIISPNCSLIYSKRNKRTIAICVCILLSIPVLLWLDFVFWHLLVSLYYVCTITDFFGYCLFYSICFLFFVLVSKICKRGKNNTYPARVLLGFLKKLDMWLYKDYMLNCKMVITNIISLIISLFLFVDFVNSDDMGGLRPLILWLVCGSKLFSQKDKKSKKHLLVFNDPLFCKKTNNQDIIFVRRKKFKTVMTGCLVKLIVILPFLSVLGFTSLEDIFIFGITAVISSMLECFTIYKNGISTQVVIYLVNTTIPVVWLCIILKHYSMIFLYAYLSVVFLISSLFLINAICAKNIGKNIAVI